jgi:hypothetical protein
MEPQENMTHTETGNGVCRPLVIGLQAPYSLDELARLCEDYHGVQGRFAYEAFRWANETIYAGRLPLPLMQWALTAYGHCIGETWLREDRLPVITLHPTIWRRASAPSQLSRMMARRQQEHPRGPRYTLDVVIHELLHVYIRYVLNHREKSKSSHDDPVWCNEVMRLSPRLGIPAFHAAPTKRQRKDGKMLRVVPEGCLPMADLARWPHTVRPDGYYKEKTVPFNYGVTSLT